MPASDQNISPERYRLIPRTLIFVRRGADYLLIKGSPGKSSWGGKYNGIGGHVERGEHILASAQRELIEETGLQAELSLCGMLIVDAGETGILLFILLGEDPTGKLISSLEGLPEWVPFDQVARLPVVEDLPVIIAKIHGMKAGDYPFIGKSYYDAENKLRLVFD